MGNINYTEEEIKKIIDTKINKKLKQQINELVDCFDSILSREYAYKKNLIFTNLKNDKPEDILTAGNISDNISFFDTSVQRLNLCYTEKESIISELEDICLRLNSLLPTK